MLDNLTSMNRDTSIILNKSPSYMDYISTIDDDHYEIMRGNVTIKHKDKFCK
jgi:hypothetical protein